MNRRRASLLLLLVLAVGTASYLAWPKKDAPLSIKLLYCPDPVAGCGDGTFEVRYSNTPEALKPFAIDVKLANAKSMHMQFAMNGMEMGLNRYRLVSQEGGLWHADVTLPVCVQGRSDWVALIEAEMESGKTARYQFSFSARGGVR